MTDCCGRKRPAIVWWLLGAAVLATLALVAFNATGDKKPPGDSSAPRAGR